MIGLLRKMKNEYIRELIVCPICKALLVYKVEKIECKNCGKFYEIYNEIPLMIDDKNTIDFQKSHEKKGLSQTLHLKTPLNEIMKNINKDLLVLDLGGGSRCLGKGVVNVDIVPYKETDVVADAKNIPFKDNIFDIVIMQALLEHVPKPHEIVQEVYRVLKPGGRIYAETPFLQPYHADPSDFQRFTINGLKVLFGNFKEIKSGVCVGPTHSLSLIISEYIPMVFNIPIVRGILYRLTRFILSPFKYIDLFLSKRNTAHIIASGVYYYGQK